MILDVCDWVIRAVEEGIAAHPPERGGALLGPAGRALVTRFVADEWAPPAASTYQPSRALDARVKQLEADEGLELKGLVHSHPRGLDAPSERDLAELAEALRQNEHLSSYLLPIVTAPAPGAPLEAHEVAAGAGKVSFFVGRRTRGGGVSVGPVTVRIVPLRRDAERVARELGGAAPETFLSGTDDGPLLAARVRLEGGLELLLLASERYPALPPVALATADAVTDQLPLEWRLEVPEAERLAWALRPWFEGPGPYRRAYGPPGTGALTRDAGRATLAGWGPRWAGGDPDGAAVRLSAALLARSAGFVSSRIASRAVLVTGCGSVGSYVAEQLARSGVGALALVDPDVVEPANLSRTAYDVRDVGRPKANALAARLLHLQPAARVAPHACAVEAFAPAELDGLVRSVDLVVAATDDPAAQRTLDRFAYARGKPAVFVGLYRGARGGEVLLTVPERTSCLLCATATRHRAERAAGRVAREPAYGTGRLEGELALAADVHHVASAAVKLALALLLRDEPGLELTAFLDRVLEEGTPYLTLSTVADYWFYPEIFRDVAGQGAYQSVWLTPARRRECPVCGEPEGRVDPLDVPLRAPRAAAFGATAGTPDD